LPPRVHVVDENNNQTVFDLVIKDGLLSEIKIRKKKGFLPISEKNQTIVKNFIHVYFKQTFLSGRKKTTQADFNIQKEKEMSNYKIIKLVNANYIND
jgi:hypothetical protein